MADDNFSKSFFLASLIGLLILTAIIFLPLLNTLLLAMVFAYIFYPAYVFFVKKTKNRRVAASLILLFVIILIGVSSFIVANSVVKEGYSLYITAKQVIATGITPDKSCAEISTPFCKLADQMTEIIKNPQVKYYLENTVGKVSGFVVDKSSGLIIDLPNIIVQLFVMLFVIFYLLLDGTALLDKVKSSVPLKAHHIDNVIKEFNAFTNATIYGHLVTACVQGVIGGLIFFALGLQAPIIAGLAMAFFGFLPFIGTPIIWAPAALSLMMSGEMSKGVLLLLLGIFVISTVDNLLRPYVVGTKTSLHPAAVLIGVIGGLFSMGLIGIIAGPLIISLLMSFIETYYKEDEFRHSH